MEKVIYNNTGEIIILDSKNEIIDEYTSCNNINIKSLPSNIFKNPELFLGKEYLTEDIDLEFIVDLYTNKKSIVYSKMTKKYYNNDYNCQIFEYDKKTAFIFINTNIKHVLNVTFNIGIITLIIKIINKYNGDLLNLN
jgi:hypothetical protein